MKPNYAEKYRDPRWQMKRLRIMERDNATCQECCEPGKHLNVHHLYYVKNREVWDYPDWALLTLCEDCHKQANPERDEEEENAQSQWEQTIDRLVGVVGFGWECELVDLAYEIHLTKEATGMTGNQVIGKLVHLMGDLRKEVSNVC